MADRATLTPLLNCFSMEAQIRMTATISTIYCKLGFLNCMADGQRVMVEDAILG